MNEEEVAAAVLRGERLLDNHTSVVGYAHVGSSSIGLDNPNDVDFVVLMPAGQDVLGVGRWEFQGFRLCSGGYDTDGQWCAVRDGHLNLILTADKGWYEKYVTANEVCRVLRIATKRDRIKVFQVIRDGFTREDYE